MTSVPDKVYKLIKELKLPSDIVDTFTKEINFSFYLGIETIEKIIDQNIVDVNPEILTNLKDYNFNLIKDMNNELASDLRATLERGINQGKGSKELSKEIKDIFKTTKQRAEKIARTELARTYNTGAYEGAKKSPIKLKKYYSAVLDNRTSGICRRLSSKYDENNPIDIDKMFYDKQSGWKGLYPPAHVNCFDKNTLITTDKGKKKIKDIKIKDKVLTHKNRFKEVYATMNRNSEDYYKVTVGTGRHKKIIEVTGEHPLLTNNGWKEVKDLTTQDWVMSL
jgi:SPP1 gp7 family putative phage head morphogenesis protein